MSDASLSQDEIDALLQGSGGLDFDEPAPKKVRSISNLDVQALGGVVAGTVDTLGANLATIVGKAVSLSGPKVVLSNESRLRNVLPETAAVIRVNLTDGMPGEHFYVMDEAVALAIAGPMTGLNGMELDESSLAALQEAFSNLCGPVVTALSEAARANVMNESPTGETGNGLTISLPAGDFAALTYGLNIDGDQIGDIVEVFDADIVAALKQANNAPAPGAAQAGMGRQAANPMMGNQGMGGQMMGNQMMGGQMMGGQMMGNQMMGNQMMGGQMMGNQGMGGGPNVQQVQFPSFAQGGMPSTEQGNIGLLMDVYMEMTVELGRTKKLIREILGMGEGTIIELDKLAGEPVDILVNHKLIAKGEVVVIDENFGVRVTEIVSPMERMNNMT